MIGLVVATHSRLAEELLKAAEMIIGPLQNVRAIGISSDQSVEEIREEMARAIGEVEEGNGGVLVMTDMFGGTPSNISLSFLEPGRLEVLTGVNLPMLLKFFNSKEELALSELAVLLKAYGQQSISLASELLRR